MDTAKLNESFYASVKKALDAFAETDNNTEVYALVFDCDSDVGGISLRYNNMAHFQEKVQNFERYQFMYEPYGKYGLHGYQYDVGDFPFLKYQKEPLVAHFLDSYYYYAIGDYYGEGEPVQGLEDSYRDIWKNMILSCIERLQKEYDKLHVTEEFVIFMVDHDQSDKEIEEYVKWTVEETLFQKLLKDSYLKES